MFIKNFETSLETVLALAGAVFIFPEADITCLSRHRHSPEEEGALQSSSFSPLLPLVLQTSQAYLAPPTSIVVVLSRCLDLTTRLAFS